MDDNDLSKEAILSSGDDINQEENFGLDASQVQQDSDCLNGSDVIQEVNQGIENESNQDLELSGAQEMALNDIIAESSTVNEIDQEISNISKPEDILDDTLTDQQSLEEANADTIAKEEVTETEAIESAASQCNKTDTPNKIEDYSHHELADENKLTERGAFENKDMQGDAKETKSTEELAAVAAVSSAEIDSRRTHSLQDIKDKVAAKVYHDSATAVTRNRSLSDLRCTIFPWMNPGMLNQ